MSELIFRGIVHGKTVELEHETNFSDGQLVTVILCPDGKTTKLSGAGIQASAGSWSDDEAGLDEFLRRVRYPADHKVHR